MKKVIILVILVLSLSFAVAQANVTTQQVASNCLNESALVFSVLENSNISLNRFNDTFLKAQDLYAAQVIIEGRKGKPNYDLVVSYCDQIRKLKMDALGAIDSYGVFLNFYHETIDSSINDSTITSIIAQIDAEIAGERYDSVPRLIDQGYAEISKVKSEQTALALAYSATARGISGFLKDNWITLVSLFLFLMAFYFLYRTKISLWILKRNLTSLLLRKDTLKGLMSTTQKDYFQYGKLSESNYRVRIKNFGELVRDIDRQIPLLQKEIAKYSFERKDYEKVKESERDRARLGRD